jgi:hypothetical protein
MTKDATLSLAARHIASGKKIILGCRGPLPMGFVIRRWGASDDGKRLKPDERIEDQPVVVIRASTFEEFVENWPEEFGPVSGKPKPGKCFFYEVTCE